LKTDQDVSQLLQRYESSSLGLLDPIRLVKAAIPDDASMKVTEIIPRFKDGGAFVKIRHDETVDPAKIEGELLTIQPTRRQHLRLTHVKKPS
jgi:hypothetical protein